MKFHSREITVRKFLINNKTVWHVLREGRSLYEFDNEEEAKKEAKVKRKQLKRNRKISRGIKMKTLKEKKEKLIREMFENKKLTKEMIDEISEIDEEISKIKNKSGFNK